MGCTLFISDLHLNEGCVEVLDALNRFLDGPAREACALYILGDLFEYWVGDDMLTLPFYLSIADRFRALCETGVKLYFQHGNRDFLIGTQFASYCGMDLLPEIHVVDLYGRRVLLMHGDLLCTTDIEYQKARVLLRSPAWQAMFLGKPLNQRLIEAGALRQKSEAAKKMKAMDIMDVHPPEVERILMEQGVTCLIHGHTHRKKHHAVDLGMNVADRWVLPDWSSVGGGLRVDSGHMGFVDF